MPAIRDVIVSLDRLAELGAVLIDAYVDSSKTRHLPVSERRVIDQSADVPVELSGIDRVALRRDILKRVRLIGQAPGASGGNNRKALRIVVEGVDQIPIDSLAAALKGDAHLSAEKFDDSHPMVDESGSAASDI